MFVLDYMVLLPVCFMYKPGVPEMLTLLPDSRVSEHLLSVFYVPGMRRCPAVYLKGPGVVR